MQPQDLFKVRKDQASIPVCPNFVNEVSYDDIPIPRSKESNAKQFLRIFSTFDKEIVPEQVRRYRRVPDRLRRSLLFVLLPRPRLNDLVGVPRGRRPEVARGDGRPLHEVLKVGCC